MAPTEMVVVATAGSPVGPFTVRVYTLEVPGETSTGRPLLTTPTP